VSAGLTTGPGLESARILRQSTTEGIFETSRMLLATVSAFVLSTGVAWAECSPENWRECAGKPWVDGDKMETPQPMVAE